MPCFKLQDPYSSAVDDTDFVVTSAVTSSVALAIENANGGSCCQGCGPLKRLVAKYGSCPKYVRLNTSMITRTWKYYIVGAVAVLFFTGAMSASENGKPHVLGGVALACHRLTTSHTGKKLDRLYPHPRDQYHSQCSRAASL